MNYDTTAILDLLSAAYPVKRYKFPVRHDLEMRINDLPGMLQALNEVKDNGRQ